MKILAIDTTTKTGSVALADDDTLISEAMLNDEITHSETLLPSIETMLLESGLSLGEIDLFALTLGPGSFTGIRIGVSTVKGFAFALGKPIAGVSTLEAMAHNFPDRGCTITPVMDARRGEVYTADFRWNNIELERLCDDRAVSPEALLDGVRGRTIFAGDGLVRTGEMLKTRFGDTAILASAADSRISGAVVARLARQRYFNGETLDPAAFAPVYLRRSEAEINLGKGLLSGSGAPAVTGS